MDGTMTDSRSIFAFKLMNDIFTYIFSIEMCIKLLAYGIKGYVKDTINVFDGSIVIISLVEVIFLHGGDKITSFFVIHESYYWSTFKINVVFFLYSYFTVFIYFHLCFIWKTNFLRIVKY